jgi:DNA adenine methylase
MKAPFVWFGGKRKVAHHVWDALGDVSNYVEPFAGSLAVLLERPHDLDEGTRRAETVNDADGFVANFWRALRHDPDAVAYYCDEPVNETDLIAKHLWLVNTGRSTLINGLEADPEFYDPKIAGWWVWGVNAWIGSGWCAGNGPWMVDDDGIVRKRPHLGDAGQGVNRQRPHLGHAGLGVNRKLPHLGNVGNGGYNNLEHRPITQYMQALADRFRDTRVCAGDWTRVVTTGALSYGTHVGIFLDPPIPRRRPLRRPVRRRRPHHLARRQGLVPGERGQPALPDCARRVRPGTRPSDPGHVATHPLVSRRLLLDHRVGCTARRQPRQQGHGGLVVLPALPEP